MGTSLREQLLRAGLVSEKQVHQAEKHSRKQARAATAATDAQKRAAAQQSQTARAAKAARDRELNRRNTEKAEAKAREAQARQLVEQHRLPSVENGTPYYFQDGVHIKRIDVDTGQRNRIVAGDVVIARLGSGFALLPSSAAARVRDRDPRAIVDFDTSAARSNRNEADAYQGFEVPDDLIW